MSRPLHPGPADTMVSDPAEGARLAVALAGPSAVYLPADLATSEARTAARYTSPYVQTIPPWVDAIAAPLVVAAVVAAILFL